MASGKLKIAATPRQFTKNSDDGRKIVDTLWGTITDLTKSSSQQYLFGRGKKVSLTKTNLKSLKTNHPKTVLTLKPKPLFWASVACFVGPWNMVLFEDVFLFGWNGRFFKGLFCQISGVFSAYILLQYVKWKSKSFKASTHPAGKTKGFKAWTQWPQQENLWMEDGFFQQTFAINEPTCLTINLQNCLTSGKGFQTFLFILHQTCR